MPAEAIYVCGIVVTALIAGIYFGATHEDPFEASMLTFGVALAWPAVSVMLVCAIPVLVARTVRRRMTK